jgi:hypothetical protein
MNPIVLGPLSVYILLKDASYFKQEVLNVKGKLKLCLYLIVHNALKTRSLAPPFLTSAVD